MKARSDMNRWFIVVGTGMLGLACMLLAGVTIYEKVLTLEPVPSWGLPASIIGGMVAGGLFTYALQKIVYQWVGAGRNDKQ